MSALLALAENRNITINQGATAIAYLGIPFEWIGSTSTMVKSHYAGTQRLAMRTGGSANANLTWLFGDHPSTSLRTSLGSTSVTADLDGM